MLDRAAAEALDKPLGRYVTLELDALARREEDAFPRGVRALAAELSALPELVNSASYLVVGLGNREITPDAVGPRAAEHILATRHLKDRLPQDFAAFRSVSSLSAGVLGTTGIESRDLVKAVAGAVRPDCVIVVDALASRSPERLCRTVQLSDTGIVPGSGVGNARCALDRESLGIPVIAVGVPTVVEAGTLAADLAARCGRDLEGADFGEAGGMIVTPRDIDQNVRDIAKLIGYALNLALHPGLSIEDVDLLVS